MYVYWRINDDSKSIFGADQHPEVHLAGSGYILALICKESTKTYTYKQISYTGKPGLHLLLFTENRRERITNMISVNGC